MILYQMRLLHYSDHEVKLSDLKNKKQKGPSKDGLHRGFGYDFKPKGFWVSCPAYEPNWKSWCEGEKFRLERLTHVHEVVLHETAKIYWANSVERVHELAEKCKTPPIILEDGYDINRNNLWLDWRKLSRRYQGIIIAPYFWECRWAAESTMWYNTWDCASGCIWNIKAIKKIELIEVNDGRETGKTEESGTQLDTASA